jgi:hypothetical protein
MGWERGSVTDVSQLFVTQGEASARGGPTPGKDKVFGTRYNGVYHMPCLPGEATIKTLPKGAAPWVPSGIQSVTTMIDGFEESRALSIWEQEQLLYGLVKQPSLYEELVILVHQWVSEGVDFSRIRDFPEVRRALTGGNNRDATEVSIVGRAKQAAGANEARQAGTNRHAAWEHRAATGELIGTRAMQLQTVSVEALLADAGLERMPGLSERVVRNIAVRTVGKFDDVLIERATGRLLIGDLKTKRKAFRSYMAVDAQLATYARSEWMLAPDGRTYEQGPLHHVDLTEGVILHAPSDGGTPYLRRADLVAGWRVAQLARQVHDERSYGMSAERRALAEWVPRRG